MPKTEMSRFPIHDDLTAPTESLPILKGASSAAGQLPNFLGVLAGAILIPAGFFLSVLGREPERPGRAIALLWAGVVVLAASLLAVGVAIIVAGVAALG